MSLKQNPVEERVTLPDGREAVVRVGVPDDSYVGSAALDTVALELRVAGETAAALNTVLEPDEDGAARALAREVAAGLESGEIEPTAGALEALALERR